MLCCICKEKQATVHLTQIAGEKVQKVDLCEECAKQKGADDPAQFSLADLLLGLGASQEMEKAAGGEEVQCPQCGFTQADFKKTGRLGCAECYQTFAEGLESLLKGMHKGTRHTGKTPKAFQAKSSLADRFASSPRIWMKPLPTNNSNRPPPCGTRSKSCAPKWPAAPQSKS